MPKGERSFSDDDILDVAKEIPDPVFTSSEISDRLNQRRRTVYRRLESMVEEGVLGKKEVGGRAVVYWIN